MAFVKATIKDLEIIKEISNNTIKKDFPQFYPTEIVDYFLSINNEENIKENIELGNVYLYMKENVAIATATITNNLIEKFYVRLGYQNQGNGTRFMGFLESEVSKNYEKVIVHSTSSSYGLYAKRGYHIKDNGKVFLPMGAIFAYQVMEKGLKVPLVKGINLNNRSFVLSVNTINGDVTNNTYFYFYQENDVIWANYSGGDVKRGFYLGKIKDDNTLKYRFIHIFKDGSMKSGNCEGEIEISSDGSLIIYEKWVSYDNKTNGRSILKEKK